MKPVASFESMLKTVEADSGVLRVHHQGGVWTESSDYAWCCSMLIQGSHADLKGTLTFPSWREIGALRKLFKELGIREVTYETKGRVVTHKEHF